MIDSILNACLREKLLISIRTERKSPDNLFIGIVRSINDSHLLFESLDPYGRVIKTISISIKSIVIIEYDEVYTNDLTKLYELNKTQKVIAKSVYIHNRTLSQFRNSLNRLKGSQELVSVFIGNDFFLGRIVDLDESDLIINCITYQGFDDGIVVFPINKIIKVRKNGLHEFKVNYLNKLKLG